MEPNQAAHQNIQKTFKHTTEHFEGIWLYTFIIKNMELFLLLHCSDEDFDEDKIHGEFFSENDYPPENIALMYRCINIDKYHDYYR